MAYPGLTRGVSARGDNTRGDMGERTMPSTNREKTGRRKYPYMWGVGKCVPPHIRVFIGFFLLAILIIMFLVLFNIGIIPPHMGVKNDD